MAEADRAWMIDTLLALLQTPSPSGRTDMVMQVIGNIFDPSTPYEGAVAMAHDLAYARLLTVDGYGHSALLNPSTCAYDYVSRYLVDGTLPPPGTVCPQDKAPFSTGSPP